MKHLYHEDLELMNEAGTEVSQTIQDAIEPVMREYINEGYSSHDVQMIAIEIITYVGAIARMDKRHTDRDKKRLCSPEAQLVEASG